MVSVVLTVFLLGTSLVWLYLNCVSSFLVVVDPDLPRMQRVSKLVVIWLVPFVGAMFVLHLIKDYAPELIDRIWLPPFVGGAVAGEPLTRAKQANQAEGGGWTPQHLVNDIDGGGGEGGD